MRSRVLLLLPLLIGAGAANAEPLTSCTQTGICYCVNADFLTVIQEKVSAIRAKLSAERAAGKATGYISIPISSLEGSYFKVNLDVATDVKTRVEAKFGVSSLYMLNPADAQWSLPDQGSAKASGADYMLMWTRVLEGTSGDGADFDFVYFTGPNDFRAALKLGDTDIMGRLDTEYDQRAATDPSLRAIDKKLFRNYYALRASVAFSLGSHDEWNIARTVNEKRRSAGRTAIGRQWGIWFDGNPVPPSAYETAAANGYAGTCGK